MSNVGWPSQAVPRSRTAWEGHPTKKLSAALFEGFAAFGWGGCGGTRQRLGKVLVDHAQKLLSRQHLRGMGAEEPRAGKSLGVVAGEFSHQHRPPLLTEPLADKLVVVEQAGFLLLDRRLGGNWLAPKSGGGLLKEPGAAEGGAGDHRPIHAVAAERFDHFGSGVEIA